MEYIELYKVQLKTQEHLQDEAYTSTVFNEYVKLNAYLNDLERSMERLTKIVKEDIGKLTKADRLELYSIANDLKSVIEQVEETEDAVFRDTKIDGVVFLIGDSTVDSHGILVEDKAYLLIDLAAYKNGKDFYNPPNFILHEYVHALHYKLNPEMYFKGFKSKKENVYKRMWVEGVATFFTKEFAREEDHVVFWLGYLDSLDVDRWLSYAEEKKKDIGSRLQEANCHGDYHLLFSVCDSEHIWKGRLAYYYGFKIVEICSKKYSLSEMLILSYMEIFECVEGYFKVV